MDDTGLGLLIAACAIAVILILLYIIWRCCYKDGSLICCEEQEGLLPSISKKRGTKRGKPSCKCMKHPKEQTSKLFV